MQAWFRWLELLCDYEIKPEFGSLPVSFTCLECSTFDDLTGRRRHHTQCSKEQCKYSNSFLASEYVLEQDEQTLKASLDAFPEQRFQRCNRHGIQSMSGFSAILVLTRAESEPMHTT